MAEKSMPALPYPIGGTNSKGVEFFTADQMHAYAQQYAKQRVAEEREQIAVLTDSNSAKADRIDRLGETVERLTAAREADRKAMQQAVEALENLHALVWGECPSLLNEDSGGNSALDMDVRDALASLRERVGG